ncbi:integrase [Inquilinus ginsengisoli]|uniref:Integrase n=1 Tax=Inquilinus ginsengisoli TaxID=363840 RepID=A0ABU1JJ11_9PROT|nr:integrase arm-type DNA-binding domain-containing protein [Inquilinus ginsengisoli]MDR6288610.1 integrase [Inquilinus ginsengisoli]
MSDKYLKAIKPAPTGKRIEIRDTHTNGLSLRVGDGDEGSGTWTVVYRHQGKQRRLTLGRYPAVSLDGARKAASKALDAVTLGSDPAADKIVARTSLPVQQRTMRKAVEDWLKRDQSENRRSTEVERIFNKDVLPKLGDRALADITRPDIVAVIDAISDRGAKIAANRTQAHMRRFFRWCVGVRGILAADPMNLMEFQNAEKERTRALSDSELAEVWRAASVEPGPFGSAVKLLMVTAARRDEIISATKVEVQGDNLVLSAERTKTDTPRNIPLTPLAQQILADLPKHKGPYLFSTTNGHKPFSGVSVAMTRLRTNIMGLRARDAQAAGRDLSTVAEMPHFTLHDLRRSAASGCQPFGVMPVVIEQWLGHESGSRSGIVRIYQTYKYEKEVRALAEQWSRHVESITGTKVIDTESTSKNMEESSE